MSVTVLVRKNTYYDSVTLMAISGQVTAIEGVSEAVVAMATEMNKDLLANVGMLTDEVAGCGANDLVLAVKAEEEAACRLAISVAEEMLAKKRAATKKNDGAPRPPTITAALQCMPEANLAVISVPGQFAAREAMQALKQGLHVMLFSDNVTVGEEKELKDYAHEHGLLVMGPDCGTAIINQTGLCFANAVKMGDIGIVGASGTGMQEVAVLIDRFGGGISQAIGIGGRDLSEAIGGRMMLDGLAALDRDENTKVIVLISKPPAKGVAEEMLAHVKNCHKPVVVCFINSGSSQRETPGIYFTPRLAEAARVAVSLAIGEPSCHREESDASLRDQARVIAKGLKSDQRYIRGLFCGGTLCDEALYVIRTKTGSGYSNIAKETEWRLDNPYQSKENTCIDLGDDLFTVGKPHPMIEPGLRLGRIVQEAKDPEVAVILLDIELGYGSHADPAGVTLPAIEEARRIAAEGGRTLVFIAYVCGTGLDKQNKAEQERKLIEAGVVLASSNAEAAILAAAILGVGGVTQ